MYTNPAPPHKMRRPRFHKTVSPPSLEPAGSFNRDSQSLAKQIFRYFEISQSIVHPRRSLRIAVVGIVIAVFFSAVVFFLFILFVFVGLLPQEDAGSDQPGSRLATFRTAFVHVFMVLRVLSTSRK